MRNRRNRRNNGTISKMYAAIIAASIVLLASGVCIFLLYFSKFYPVYVNGEIDVVRRIVRYGLYILCFAGGIGSMLCIDAALEKLKEYTSIKKSITRYSR